MPSEKKLDIDVEGFDCHIGVVDGEKRPTCVYLSISSNISPKLSVFKAKSDAINRPKDLAKQIIDEFFAAISDYGLKHIGANFDEQYFDPNSVVCFISDIYPVKPFIGMPQSFVFEINIDTVNSVDSSGNPKAHSDGKVYNYELKDFMEPAKASVEKLLGNELFGRSSLVKFSTK